MSIVGNLPVGLGARHPIVRTSELEESQVPTMTEERIAGLIRVQRSASERPIDPRSHLSPRTEASGGAPEGGLPSKCWK
jgi:hypothetical protein